MPTVFISYRRSDSADIAGRLYDRLVERYGEAGVFKDVDSIPHGANFPKYIAESIAQSDVALIIIGPRWLDASAGWGRRRLDDPADFVRIEIETALRLGVAAIPVLVGGARLPPAKRLPTSLRPLLEQNGMFLRQDPDFTRDLERIIHSVDYWQAQPRTPQTVADPAPDTPDAAASTPATPAATPSSQAATPRPSRVAAPVAIAESVEMTAKQKRQVRVGRRGLVSTSTIVAALVVSVLVFVLHGLANTGGASVTGPEATQTAIAAAPTATAKVLGMQPYTGIGPCDTAHTYNQQTNPYYWDWGQLSSVICSGNSTARLAIDSASSSDTVMGFYGLPYYGPSASFPSHFTAKMTIRFTYSDPVYYDCASVGWNITNEPSSKGISNLYVCQDGTWYLSGSDSGPQPSSNRHPFDVTHPFTVTITVTGPYISVMLNNTQAMPNTRFDGQFESLGVALWNAPDKKAIEVSNFEFTPSNG